MGTPEPDAMAELLEANPAVDPQPTITPVAASGVLGLLAFVAVPSVVIVWAVIPALYWFFSTDAWLVATILLRRALGDLS